MYTERVINITISYVAIEGQEFSAWTEAWEGVYKNVTYQCFQFLTIEFPACVLLNGYGCAEGGWTGPGVAKESVLSGKIRKGLK